MADEEVLRQSEIDALISAITAGEVEVEMGGAPSKSEQVVVYDFKRPERIARDQLRAIETLHEVFARNLQASLSALLRVLLDIRVSSVDQLTYSEFVNSLPNPTCFNVLSCEPLEGNFIFEINPVIAFPILERLLGSGKAMTTHPERPLTDIEWRLMHTIIDKALQLMREVWSSVQNMNFRVTTRESNPQLIPLMSPNEPVIAVGIDVSFAEHKGFINICIPDVTIEGIMDKLTTITWFTHKKKETTPGFDTTISKSIAGAEVNVIAYLAESNMKVADLMELSPGDVILTEHPQGAPILLAVEGEPKFWAKPGAFKNHKAVRIVSTVNKDETLRI
ncbi:MAG: flagellar motor switch protein FliM [Candidatus Schekmanbacteria bacterium RBG_16_38_10]|uniref:Flagellar motor switch protein FliM n=1 Tax=Candidatus Schekmanbacteria bacterium RBG_16_38_10 TaxID=1817879 RepID=A0A1F7RRA3_9BACT|nr:MAG: flagellar motor switch protein FliM [Candidatus Schekmanbacteria bacterium RBG_16_38_10]